MDDQQLKQINDRVTVLAQHLRQHGERVNAIATTVNQHDEAINAMSETQKTMGEILELFVAMKGGITVIGWIGTFIKWFWPVAAFGIAVWIFVKTGRWELKP